MADHAAAFGRRRIPAPGQNPDGGERFPGPSKHPFKFFKRPEEVSLDIVVQRPERRHVQDTRSPCWPLSVDELVQPPKKSRHRLPAPGRGRDQEMLAGGDLRPGFFLKVRGGAHLLRKPPGDQGVK